MRQQCLILFTCVLLMLSPCLSEVAAQSVSAGPAVKETQYIHLESYELPPHWQDIER